MLKQHISGDFFEVAETDYVLCRKYKHCYNVTETELLYECSLKSISVNCKFNLSGEL